MAKYDLKLKSTDAGTQKARTLTLTNVNPEASANTLKQFTQQLNQLTTNTYVGTDYVVTTNLDTETPPIDTRQTPTLSLAQTPTLSQIATPTEVAVNYNGDGNIYIRRDSGILNVALAVVNRAATPTVGFSYFNDMAPVGGGTFVVGATGTDNYKPIEVEYTLA